uniref:(northern house mosquito) hypothetical protein n=1 Tax=Culex pipiens TaxID=7175 RepID=A0A8D8DHS5_CULPI
MGSDSRAQLGPGAGVGLTVLGRAGRAPQHARVQAAPAGVHADPQRWNPRPDGGHLVRPHQLCQIRQALREGNPNPDGHANLPSQRHPELAVQVPHRAGNVGRSGRRVPQGRVHAARHQQGLAAVGRGERRLYRPASPAQPQAGHDVPPGHRHLERPGRTAN